MNEIDIVLLIISIISGFVFSRYDKRIFWFINDRINFYYYDTFILDDVIIEHHLFWDHLHFHVIHKNEGIDMGFGDPRGGK